MTCYVPFKILCGLCNEACKLWELHHMQGKGDVEDRATNAGRPLRERKVVKPCPTCKADIADFLAHGQVNR